jgi:predicted nucleic acid-binding protein
MQTFISDTSFLFSIFGNDTHTLTARAWIRQYQRPISVSVLNYYEFQNAIRFAAFRKAISRTEAVATLDAFESDLKSGHLQSTSVDFGAVFAEASTLSANYTFEGGHRSFDILHIAIARLLKASTFLSFDENQRRLASSVRLNVGP